jgi:MFS family permease
VKSALKAWTDLKHLPRELWVLCLATLVNRMGTMALPFLTLYLTSSLGFPAARAGAALAIYGGVGLVAGPLAGALSDRLGARRLMEGALAASGVVLLLFPLVHSWAGVIVMTALFAVTNEGFRPVNMALVGELGAPEYRKSAFALSRLALNLGMSIGPAVGGFLAQRSFTILFAVDGFTALASASILVLSSFRKTEKQVVREPVLTTWLPVVGLRDWSYRTFLLGIFPVAMVFWQHESTMPLFLVRNLHLSESAYGMLFTINTLMIVALEIPLNSATAHWPHRRCLALGSLLFAIGFGALALAHTALEVALTVVIWTFGEMILFPSLSAYVIETAPEGRRGEYMGLYSMTFGVALMAGSVAGTWELDRRGPTTLWISTCVAGIISAFILGRMRSRPANIDTQIARS